MKNINHYVSAIIISLLITNCEKPTITDRVIVSEYKKEPVVFVPGVTIFEEIDGIVAVEAEHYTSQSDTTYRKWCHWTETSTPGVLPDPDKSHVTNGEFGASGGEYIEVLPDTRVTGTDPMEMGSFTNTPGKYCILNYPIFFNNTGKYYVWARIYSIGTEDNGIHVGIDSTWPASGTKMQWCTKHKWYWDSKQRTSQNHCGESELIYLNIKTRGLHTISFSQREDGFEFDKFVMVIADSGYNRPEGLGPDEKVRR